MPGEPTKSKSAGAPNARQMTAERKHIDARHSSPDKRSSADTSGQSGVAQVNRNAKTLRKVLQPPVKAKVVQGVSTPRPTRNLSLTQSAVVKATSLSTLPKVSSQNSSAPKPPLPPSKRSNSVPAVKQKPAINSHQQPAVAVRNEIEHHKQIEPSSIASSHRHDKKCNEKREVEKVVPSCNFESSSPSPLKIFPSFRGEYPTRHRPATGHQQWFQRTAAGKTRTETVASMEIADDGVVASALPDNDEGCTTVTETHYLSFDCPTGCEPASKNSCMHCANVDANSRRYEEYPFYGDQQTPARHRQAFTHQHQLQQQQQQQQTTFGNSWPPQMAAEQTPYNGFQQTLPADASTPLSACSEVWPSTQAFYSEPWQQARLQSGNVHDMWQSTNGQPPTQSQNASTSPGQQNNGVRAHNRSATQKQGVSTTKNPTSRQVDMKAFAQNEISQKQSAAQGSEQLMQYTALGGGQQPATSLAASCSDQQACLQAQLLALRMTEQVHQQMMQTQQQIAQVQKQLESGQRSSDTSEPPKENQAEASQEQVEGEQAVQVQPHPHELQEQPQQSHQEQQPQEQLQQQELPQHQQFEQQLPEGGMPSMLQQAQAAGTSPFEQFNQGVDYFQALASQQTLMSLPTMGSPMMGQTFPLPFGDPQNGNFLSGPQPFPSGMMPPQNYDPGLMGQPMPVMGGSAPQGSFMGLPNGFPMPGLGNPGGNGGLMPMTPPPMQPNMYPPYQNNHCYMPCYRPRCGNMRYMMPRWHQ